MARALAEACSDDEGTRSLIIDAYLASYASLGQVAMIRKESLLGDGCAAEVRDIRRAAEPPHVPMRVLTAGQSRPPALQNGYEALHVSLADAWPNGNHVAALTGGHYIHKDAPDAVLDAISAVSR